MHNKVVSRAARLGVRLSILLLASLGACELPTRLPSWNQTWLIPGDSTRFSVSELLPTTGVVTMSTFNAQAVFALNVGAPGSVTRTLGQICPACAAANGTTVPKPAFTLRDSTSASIPSEVVSATIVNGSFNYTITNGFSFDPIRPNAAGAPYGYFVLKVMNGATLVALDSVDGATVAMGTNGATLQRSAPVILSGGSLTLSSASPIKIYLTLNSPSGDPVAINSNQSIAIAIQIPPVSSSQVQVQVTNQTISAAPTSIDLSSVNDQALINRVQSGTLHLLIASPFGVQGNLTATFSVPGAQSIVKNVQLTTAAQQSHDISLTGAEFRSLLGHTADLTVSGNVGSPTGVVTLRPTQVLTIISTFEIILSTTEN